jgi:hypothetical protein
LKLEQRDVVRTTLGMEEVFFRLTWGSIHDYDLNEHDKLMTFQTFLGMAQVPYAYLNAVLLNQYPESGSR